MPTPNVSPAINAVLPRVRGLLAQGKWRQARDELKPLVKADRGLFLPLLIEANLGLARKMLAGGQAAEARQVLTYLTTIAPAEQLRAFELEVAANSGVPGESLPRFVAALAAPGDTLSAAQRTRLADAVVLAFAPVTAIDSAQAGIAAEVQAIHEALRAVSQREWTGASEALRRVSHRSAFSHWAALIKGIMAFHTGDTDRAVKHLRNLPADSVPEKAARAYLLIAVGPAAEGTAGPAPPAAEVSEAVVAGICRLVGATDVSALLLRAEKLWREGRHAESYRVLRDGVRHFPSCEPDWAGAISDFYFKAPHSMGAAQGMDFLRFFSGRIFEERLKSSTEAMYAYRLFSLMGQAVASTSELCEDWENFLRERETLLGSNARFSSLAYGWLGEQLAMTRRQRGYFAGPPRLRNAEGAVEYLRRSIELDPGNLAANLQLCTVYGALKRNSERNRLLDEMTARFPDEKQVLVRAAEGCIERKAFGKGLGYLERARQLDQLDPQIPDLTVRALWAQARQQFEQQRPEKARQVLAQADAWLTDKPDDFQRGRWTALVRQALMERLWGDAALGGKLLEQAGGLASSRATFLVFAHLAHRVHEKKFPRGSPFLGELEEVLRKAPRLGEIGQLLRVVKFWHGEADELRTFDEEGLIARAIPATLNQPFTRAEAADVIERAGDNPEFTTSLKKLVKTFLHADPLDPQARLWAIDIDGLWTMDPTNSRAKFQSILDEAARRHDEASMRRARQLIRELANPPPMPDPFGPHFVEPDDEDEEDDYGEDDGPLPPIDLPPGMMEEFKEVIEALRTAPESTIRELRKTVGREMPDFLFEALVALAKSGPLPPLRPKVPPPPKAQPRSSEPTSDPNQLNLF